MAKRKRSLSIDTQPDDIIYNFSNIDIKKDDILLDLIKKINNLDSKLSEIDKINIKIDKLHKNIDYILVEKDYVISNLQDEINLLKNDLKDTSYSNDKKINDYFC